MPLQLQNVLQNYRVMQALLVKGVDTCLIALHDTEHLDVLGEEAWRQKAMDAQLEPFLQSKCHAL